MYNKWGSGDPPNTPWSNRFGIVLKHGPYTLHRSGDQTTNTHVVMTIYIGRCMLATTMYVEIVLRIGI